MQDPLDPTRAPYEILGVPEGAGPAEVDAAFRRAAITGRDVARATRAWQALKNQGERAYLDVLRFDDDVLRRLAPDALAEPAVLDLEHRAATAAAWEDALRADPGDLGLGHALAVLWFWWAVHVSGSPRPAGGPEPVPEPGEPGSAGPPAPAGPGAFTLWERAIGCWGALLAAPEFWAGRSAPEQAGALAERVEQAIRGRLDYLAEACRDAAADPDADRFRGLELALDTEVRTARTLASSGIRLEGRLVRAGPLLLGRLGLRERVTRSLTAAVTRDPGDAAIRAARDALSPYGDVAALIAAGRPADALDRIGRLPSKARGTETVSSLRVRALLALGASEADLGEAAAAVEHLGQALRAARRDEDEAAARAALLATTRQAVAARFAKDDDGAVDVLETAYGYSADEGLKATLAELLTRRAVRAINQAGSGPDRPDPAAAERVLRAGERDLRRAADLGSAAAAEQLVSARTMLAQVSKAAEVESAVATANRAAEKGDWNGSVEALRRAVAAAGAEAPPGLRRNLAVALTNRATATANRAVESVAQQRRRAGPPDLDAALEQVRAAYRGRRAEVPQAPSPVRPGPAVLAVVLAWLFLFLSAESADIAADPFVRGALGLLDRTFGWRVDLAEAGGRALFAAGSVAIAGVPLAAGRAVGRRRAAGPSGRRAGRLIWLLPAAALGAGWWWLFRVVPRNPRFSWTTTDWGHGLVAAGLLALSLAAVAGIAAFVLWIYRGLALIRMAISDWIERQTRSVLPRAGSAEPCVVCGADASYRVRGSPRLGEVALCSAHARELEAEAGRAALTESDRAAAAGLLVTARADLTEAMSVAPDLAGAKESRNQVDRLIDDLVGSASASGGKGWPG